ncbi:MAG: DUF6268 family outer membrane beta-barrel protein [Bacteroidota bacterium]
MPQQNNVIKDNVETIQSPDDDLTHLLNGKLRFPVKLRGNTKLFGELKYKNEFLFNQFSSQRNELENLNLHNSEIAFYALSKLSRDRFLIQRFAVNNRSDEFSTFNKKTAGASASFVYGWETPKVKYGFGLAIDRSYRNLQFLPIFLYQRDLPRNYYLDIQLPGKIEVGRSPNANTRLFAAIDGSSANYFLNREVLGQNDVIYRRLTINTKVGFEHNLTEWIGIGAEAGVASPLRSGLFEAAQRRNQIIDHDQRFGPYFNVKFFVSPSRALLKKL